MNTEKTNQEVLNEEVVIDIVDSEDLQKILDKEQEIFEDGIDTEDEIDVEMDEQDINEQTIIFLKLRGKRKG